MSEFAKVRQEDSIPRALIYIHHTYHQHTQARKDGYIQTCLRINGGQQQHLQADD